VPVGSAVLEQACEQMVDWQAEHGKALSISVNLSARQVSHPSLVETVEKTLERTGLDPGRVSLEITESVLFDDAETALQTLRGLKDLGISLVLDDFGTGYSSLAHLKRFPIDVLKIDRSFVDGLGHDKEDSAIVAAVISMARALGIDVVAEGVETQHQATQLRLLGCPLAQGYLFARPMRPEAALAMVQGAASGDVGVSRAAG
jgi:EAL domain-containing protein (putative c-di-GMP-specific phosphodiesterase class I)